jgi:hypothetical protein
MFLSDLYCDYKSGIMVIEKKIIGTLEKCYSLAMLNYNNTEHFLVAAEKINSCLLFDLDGNFEEEIWKEPGGVMSMVQVPGSNGEFLATHRFYSFNDAKDASIIKASPKRRNRWEIKTIVKLPFVHRFDILSHNGYRYLIASTIKSGHEHKDDWSTTGKVYAAPLPDDISMFNGNKQLRLEIIQDGCFKNHGYTRYIYDGQESGLVSCEQGVFQFIPPENPKKKWDIRKMISDPASEAALLDIDNDGSDELISFSPFHGNTINSYKKQNGNFTKFRIFPQKFEFLHAAYAGIILNKPTLIAGHRRGEQELLALVFDHRGNYEKITLDKGCGSANVLYYKHKNSEIIISANREINEIAMYRLT